MATTILYHHDTAYDKVGAYNQDAINGFSEELLDHMLDLVNPARATSILDAMAGNGNLSWRLYEYCGRRGINVPTVCVLDVSSVQCAFAREKLSHTNANVIWGNVLTMEDCDTGNMLPEAFFDRVMIKSGSHEIPLEKQMELYQSLHRILKPGGWFVNLGLLFDDVEERDHFQALGRLKDHAAGLCDAVKNRHYLTREEFYSCLQQAGFMDIQCARHFQYTIDSSVLVREYFPEHKWEEAHADIQAQHARAIVLRRKGCIHFERDRSIMTAPGEITVAWRGAEES